MENKEVGFRYDALYLIEDRYEFKKIRKRSFMVIFCGIFNKRMIYVILYTLLVCVSVWLLLTFILDGSIKETQFLPLSGPLILIPVLTFYDRHKNRIIKRKDVISVNVKDNILKILYTDRGKKTVKEVELPRNAYIEPELSDILGYDIMNSSVIDWTGSDKFHFKMGMVGCFIGVLLFMYLLKDGSSIGLIITSVVLFICLFISMMDNCIRLLQKYHNDSFKRT